MESRILELHIYDAGKGDCLHLRFLGQSGIYHNILIDSGTARFGNSFANLCEKIIQSGEKIDLLLITHVDEDHLGGLLYLVKSQLPIKISAAAMNHPNQMLSEMADTPLTAQQNDEIFRGLALRKIPVQKLLRDDMISMDGAFFYICHPTPETLSQVFPPQEETDVLLEAGDTLRADLEALMEKELPPADASRTNAASVIFIFEYNGKRLLFTGDGGSANILACVRSYARQQKIDLPVFFDAVKLPHHGSARNISERWPSIIQANRFIVCANGAPHPNKLTIAKLLKWYGSVELDSARDWWDNKYLSKKDICQFIEPGKLCLRHMKGDAIIWQS